VGKDRISVPVAPKPQPVEKPAEPPPPEPLTIPAKPLESAEQLLAGVLKPVAPAVTTQGPGSGGGGGTGVGTGAGDGRGSGLGPGFGGGTGGGAYKPGSGVSSPQLLREVKPNYTVDAMRAKVHGAVLLECVVETDGAVEECRVMKSLDKVFGLDDEALKAARQWRFVPGHRFGEPVRVLVTIELTFTLR
jgi:TonB family protein